MALVGTQRPARVNPPQPLMEMLNPWTQSQAPWNTTGDSPPTGLAEPGSSASAELTSLSPDQSVPHQFLHGDVTGEALTGCAEGQVNLHCSCPITDGEQVCHFTVGGAVGVRHVGVSTEFSSSPSVP